MGSHKTGSDKVGFLNDGVVQVGFRKFGPPKVGSCKVGTVQVGFRKFGACQVSTVQVDNSVFIDPMRLVEELEQFSLTRCI